MKKLLLVLMIVGVALAAAACRAEMNVFLDINEDQSAAMTVEFGLDDELTALLESSGGTTDDLLGEMDFADEGGEAFVRTEDDMTYTGVKMEFDSIADMKKALSEENGGDGMFNQFSFVMDESSAELTASITAPEEDSGDLPIAPEDLTEDLFSANLIVGMPGNVVEHNADKVLPDGRLSWSLPLLGGSVDVHARSELGGSAIPWLWIILGIVLVLGIIAVIVAVVLGKKQQKQAVDDAAAAYPQSASEQLESSSPDDGSETDDTEDDETGDEAGD